MRRLSPSKTTTRLFCIFLGCLLLCDLVFAALHVLTPPQSLFWKIGLDHTASEWYQYIKAASGAFILFWLYRAHPSLTYLGWGLALLFIALDDSLRLHERVTEMLERASAPEILGMQAHDYGASVLWGIVGLGLMVLFAIGYARNPETRAFSRRAALLLALLFVAGGVVDSVREHAGTMSTDWLRYIFHRTIMVEDGGELVLVSLLVGLSLWQFLSVRATRDVRSHVRVIRSKMLTSSESAPAPR